jgi:hypothetical protein
MNNGSSHASLLESLGRDFRLALPGGILYAAMLKYDGARPPFRTEGERTPSYFLLEEAADALFRAEKGIS